MTPSLLQRPCRSWRIEHPYGDAADIFAIADEYVNRRHVGRRDIERPADLQRHPPARPPLGLHLGHVLGMAAEIDEIGVAAAPLLPAMPDLPALVHPPNPP